MTREEEEALAPFLDAFAQLLLAEDDRRQAEREAEHEKREHE